MDRPVWEKSWVLERLRNCFWGCCCRPDGKDGGRGSTRSCSFSPLVCHGLWISARTLIVLKSEEWRQQDGEMDEAQLSLVILKVEERVFFWSLVWMSAGFATELLRGSLLVWICGFRWFAGCDWWSLGTREKFVICRQRWKSSMFGLVLNNTTGCCWNSWNWREVSSCLYTLAVDWMIRWARSSLTCVLELHIDGLSECGLDYVEEFHFVRDAEEAHSSSTVIHIHCQSRSLYFRNVYI